MTGTWINVTAVFAGSLLGLMLGQRIPERIRHTVMSAIGFFTLALGIQMFIKTTNAIVVLLSLLIGVLLGEWWKIEDRIEKLGKWIELRLSGRSSDQEQSHFVQGFLATSLLYCVGPLAILGAIQDGLTADYSILSAKAVLDGFTSIAFSSALGIGVILSSIPLLLYQGGISLAAAQLQQLVTPAMMTEMTATGGIILIALAVSTILHIYRVRVGNMLPALLVAPLLVAFLTAMGWITP
ncbi:MAG: DUF554 domain-containing protein [Anaerolineaceae bacterium]|nr:DUF554 domain-containing protein [Anaerolineaceae bacterium]